MDKIIKVQDIFLNYPLMCAAVAWLLAQIIKGFTGAFHDRKFSIATFLFGCGGMPSSHSSAVMALAVACIIQYGWFSSQFAIAAVLAAIVMRDASGVRRETGEQSRVINMILNELIEGKSKDIDANLKEIMGHTPLQVFVGALLGIAVPFGMAAIML